MLTDGIQRSCRHLVGQPPCLLGQRCCLGDNRHIHARADARTACAPESAGAAWHLLAPFIHFRKRRAQFNAPARIPVCRQQCRTNHHMVLRAMHVAKVQRHHPFKDVERVLGFFLQAY